MPAATPVIVVSSSNSSSCCDVGILGTIRRCMEGGRRGGCNGACRTPVPPSWLIGQRVGMADSVDEREGVLLLAVLLLTMLLLLRRRRLLLIMMITPRMQLKREREVPARSLQHSTRCKRDCDMGCIYCDM